MKFADIDNIWSVNVNLLSNADRGHVYYERAKQVIQEALADPNKRQHAVEGTRFRRNYLVEKVGCKASVTTQNPRIRLLLADIDVRLEEQTDDLFSVDEPESIEQVTDITRLRAIAAALQRRVERQARLIARLRSTTRGR